MRKKFLASFALLIVTGALTIVLTKNPSLSKFREASSQWHSIDSPQGKAIHQQMIQMQNFQQQQARAPAAFQTHSTSNK